MGKWCWLAIATLVFALGAAADEARVGPIHVLSVTAPDAVSLHRLVEGGYDVATVHGLTATVFATDAERDELLGLGWPVSEMDQAAELEKTLGVYHTYASLTSELQAYAAARPDICRLQSLGQSYQGRELWAMLITDNPDANEDEPEVKYVGSMHGNEPVGMELCLYLIDLVLNQYGTDQRITSLVDSTALWIVPLMNPDGLTVNSRFNAQGLDLNREFPDYPGDYTGTIFNAPASTSGVPPEVACIVNWTASQSFTLAANFHTGNLVVNYPYDHAPGIPSYQPAISPDEALFQEISRAYSVHNSPMWNSAEFEDGITNGSAWYSITGSMQDWDYRFAGVNSVTIEVSNTFRPAAETLAQLWEDNRESMLSYAETAQTGVRGVVTDADSGQPLYAQVMVQGNSQPVFTDPGIGDYHRMLLPGTYTLVVSAPGYPAQTVENVVVTDGPATVVDVELRIQDLPVSPILRLILMLLFAIFGLRLIFGKRAGALAVGMIMACGPLAFYN